MATRKAPKMTMRSLVANAKPNKPLKGKHTFTITYVHEDVDKKMMIVNITTSKNINSMFVVSPKAVGTAGAILEALDYFGVDDLRDLEGGEFTAEFEVVKKDGREYTNVKRFIL